MESFYATPYTNAYKCCINFADTEFRTEYSASAYTFVGPNHGERATERRQWRRSSMTSFVLNWFAEAQTCL